MYRRDDVCLPTSDKSSLVSAFADHFTDKILSIKLGLCSLKSDRGIESTVSDLSCGSSLTEFNPVSPDKLSQLLGGSGLKVCSLDPLPSLLMRNCVDVLLPIVTNIVNCSLDSYTVPHVMKEALVRPILKKASLDHEQLKNYRPISNLPFIAKCCEKVVADQLNQYLAVNELNEVFQSAYKRYHSTETALIRVQNDILPSIDDGGCVMLLLLDMSAAFDTVNHSILLSRLSTYFGISSKALAWFRSYLHNRSQFISIDSYRSTNRPLTCGVPQGSVLGPILYLMYVSPVGCTMRRHGVSYHMYADDPQVYITFKSDDLEDLEIARGTLEQCIVDVNNWMLQNNLKLNQDKSELIVMHAKDRLKPSLESIQVGESTIVPSDSARNIGVIFFDSTFSLDSHITELCKTAFYHLRTLSKIRRYLSYDTTKVPINAFVISRLDNCNSLMYGLPKYLIDRVQHVFNCAAKLITLSKKYDHVTPLLIELHWLPVEYRIIFKILLITFKILNGIAPNYLKDLLEPYVPRRTLRSMSKLRLVEPSYKLSTYGFRASSVCAPSLWNGIPLEIRQSNSVSVFKKNLKTHLFKQAF